MKKMVAIPEPCKKHAGGLISAHNVAFISQKVVLPLPQTHVNGSGKLTVETENGIVKGFEYQCNCGRKDHFECQ